MKKYDLQILHSCVIVYVITENGLFSERRGYHAEE